MEMVSDEQKRALENIIPYSSVVKLIGVEREPVAAFSPKSMAA